MARNGPGKQYRKGLTLAELFDPHAVRFIYGELVS